MQGRTSRWVVAWTFSDAAVSETGRELLTHATSSAKVERHSRVFSTVGLSESEVRSRLAWTLNTLAGVRLDLKQNVASVAGFIADGGNGIGGGSCLGDAGGDATDDGRTHGPSSSGGSIVLARGIVHSPGPVQCPSVQCSSVKCPSEGSAIKYVSPPINGGGVADGSGRKRLREDQSLPTHRQEEPPEPAVPIVSFEVRLHATRPQASPARPVPESEGALESSWLEVVCLPGSGRGQQLGTQLTAFWPLAERIRNDIVRDTRKWRRMQAAAAQTATATPAGDVESRAE